VFLEDVELVLERALREANRRAWEEARSRPIPSVELEPINWESPVRQSFAEEAPRYYLQVLFLHGQSIHEGGSPPHQAKAWRRGRVRVLIGIASYNTYAPMVREGPEGVQVSHLRESCLFFAQ